MSHVMRKAGQMCLSVSVCVCLCLCVCVSVCLSVMVVNRDHLFSFSPVFFLFFHFQCPSETKNQKSSQTPRFLRPPRCGKSEWQGASCRQSGSPGRIAARTSSPPCWRPCRSCFQEGVLANKVSNQPKNKEKSLTRQRPQSRHQRQRRPWNQAFHG